MSGAPPTAPSPLARPPRAERRGAARRHPSRARRARNARAFARLPQLSLGAKGQSVGIFVARVTATRMLLGRKVPRTRGVGRVPLGAAVKGVDRFRWDGKVDGRRLRAGTCLITYRALKKERILSTSGLIRFTVKGSGKIVKVRRQP